MEVEQAGNVEEKRHLERAGSHPNHSCEGVVWPVQVSAAWRSKRGGKQADSEGGQGPGRGPNLCSLGVPASSRGTVQLHDALNKPVFFKMRIASHFCVFKIFLLLKFQNTTEGKSVISCHPGTVPQLQ